MPWPRMRYARMWGPRRRVQTKKTVAPSEEGFFGSVDVIVEFWDHLDGIRFYLAVQCKLVMGLEMQKLNIYICSFL